MPHTYTHTYAFVHCTYTCDMCMNSVRMHMRVCVWHTHVCTYVHGDIGGLYRKSGPWIYTVESPIKDTLGGSFVLCMEVVLFVRLNMYWSYRE